MPSFFNPVRTEAPGCTWTHLRDPACGGAVNERASARRGRETIFEKALVKLPLTRCRRCVVIGVVDHTVPFLTEFCLFFSSSSVLVSVIVCGATNKVYPGGEFMLGYPSPSIAGIA